MAVTAGDVYAFRAENPGDYSSGYFRLVMNGPGVNTTQSITLVEQAVTVGGDVVWLPAIFCSHSQATFRRTTFTGTTPARTIRSLLIDGR